MLYELEQKLTARWPTWFNVSGDIRNTLMPRGFQHGDGWFDLLWRLCVDLEPLVREFERQAGKSFEVLTVKQKFGSLRFRPIGGSDLIWTRIAAAQEESA
jgi:hypothetical protein